MRRVGFGFDLCEWGVLEFAALWLGGFNPIHCTAWLSWGIKQKNSSAESTNSVNNFLGRNPTRRSIAIGELAIALHFHQTHNYLLQDFGEHSMTSSSVDSLSSHFILNSLQFHNPSPRRHSHKQQSHSLIKRWTLLSSPQNPPDSISKGCRGQPVNWRVQFFLWSSTIL